MRSNLINLDINFKLNNKIEQYSLKIERKTMGWYEISINDSIVFDVRD